MSLNRHCCWLRLAMLQEKTNEPASFAARSVTCAAHLCCPPLPLANQSLRALLHTEQESEASASQWTRLTRFLNLLEVSKGCRTPFGIFANALACSKPVACAAHHFGRHLSLALFSRLRMQLLSQSSLWLGWCFSQARSDWVAFLPPLLGRAHVGGDFSVRSASP